MVLSRTLTLLSLLVVSLLLPSAYATTVPIEQTMSSRLSVREYTNANITQQQLLSVLRGAYGYWGDHRAVPSVSSDYSITLFSVNATGSYLYDPVSNA